MSQIKFECQINDQLSGHGCLGSGEKFVQAVVEAQNRTAYEELGDTLEEGAEFMDQCEVQAGVTLPQESKKRLFKAVNHCLQQRFMSNCQVAPSCTGREAMEVRISKLSELTRASE